MPALAKRVGIAVLIIGVLAGVGPLLESVLTEYAMRIIILCGISIILAVGLNLINGTTGQFSIGHAGFMAVGAYGTAYTVIMLEDHAGAFLSSLPEEVAHGGVLIAGLSVGALVAGVAGLLVGAPSLRLRGDYLAIVTLGFGEIIRLVFNNASALGGPTGYDGGRPAGLPAYTNFFWVYACAAAVIAVVASLTFSRFGRALSAIREDELAAEAMGIPTTRLKVTAFIISAMTAGVAGGLFAHLQSSIRPDDFKFDKSIDVIVMIIVGGLGSISGAALGAVVVVVALELLRDAQEYRLILYPLLLILLMILRPKGILGRHELSISYLRNLFSKKTATPPTTTEAP